MTINVKSKLKKYTNITDAIIDYANEINDNFQTNIVINIKKDNLIDYSNELQTVIFNKSKQEFSKIGKKYFINNKDIIYVTNEDIKEIIAKTVRNLEQKKLINEQISLFSNLDKIIYNGKLITYTKELKNRQKYLKWKYYATPIKINRSKYIVEFDTVLRSDNEIHFRIMRLYKLSNINRINNIKTDYSDRSSE